MKVLYRCHIVTGDRRRLVQVTREVPAFPRVGDQVVFFGNGGETVQSEVIGATISHGIGLDGSEMCMLQAVLKEVACPFNDEWLRAAFGPDAKVTPVPDKKGASRG